MLSASSHKIIQVLVCSKHGHARQFWLTIEIFIFLVNLKCHQDQLECREHKVFYGLMPDA